ncbi:Murein DD-endopeptidase MepM and murein hydrolase activator NlpD, contain LysM domain [Micromonospora viridifaciens]|uniref:Murein DD-endopeptidase MepM and murein hydrolase activator NlpD, contain LysM domain n=1 Tax=Micromonospora viridifaciens TaxID=1881 RepID=A0A1C4V550_MICVI|nr:M23 family metallopeptidase [Micromonospora viridifaciens]SCE79142.1 Murein DD-endopeptidase MepM and murein hydrolase activator NlpD, contain LysM domain [Micromonospora viridifaciens]
MKVPVQEDSSIQNENARETRGRHRAPTRTGRRATYLAVGAIALVGLGLGGVSVATADRGTPAPVAVDFDARARAEAAARADRSARESTDPVTPSATVASASPSVASPSVTPASPSPSPSTASPKPKPKPTATAKPKPRKTTAPKPAWVIPMAGADITSCFGPRWGTLHAGIDFAMPGGTPIHAAAAGTVVKAGDAGDGYGNSVLIDHHNGYLTHYAHQSRLIVSVGDKVSAGQVIGYEGATGDATGPHLHFEVHQGTMWNQIDPAPFLRARGIDVAC